MIKNDNLKGAFYMAIAMLGFSANDAIVKSVTGQLNVGEIIFVRGLFASVLIFAIAKGLGALRPLRTVLSLPIIVRSLCEVGAAVCYIYALGKIPIANTYSHSSGLASGRNPRCRCFLPRAGRLAPLDGDHCRFCRCAGDCSPECGRVQFRLPRLCSVDDDGRHPRSVDESH